MSDRSRSLDSLIPLLAGAIALGLYLATLPPGLTWWFGGADSGDLAAAATVLGIPHPTGYPLFTLLGWLATRVPFGEPAGRLNVMNAVFGAMTVAITARIVLETAKARGAGGTLRPAVALAAALTLGTAGLVWSQAIITEVYALNLLLAAVIAWLTVRQLDGHGSPLLLGLAHGCALANHVTALFAVLATLAALAAIRPRPTKMEASRYAAGLLLGLALYLLLPLRAAQDPAVNWGDPDTPGRFLTHITGGQYGGFLAWTDVIGNLRELARLLRLLLGDVAMWAIPAAVAGASWGWREARAVTVFCLTLGGLSLLFAAGYRVPDRAIYALPGYLAYALLAGFGLLAACERIAERPASGTALAAIAIAALTGGWAARGFITHDLHGDRTPAVLAEAVLQPLPAGARVITGRDDATFTLRYAQLAQKRRPDVSLVDIRELLARSQP